MIKILASAALFLAAAAPAAAATYVTDTKTYTGLGDTIGSPFDQITLNGVSSMATGPGTYLANTVDFVVGVNAPAGVPYTVTGMFTNGATVDGSPISYTVPYTITIGAADTIVIGGNTFYTNGVKVHFNTLTFTNINTTASGDLTATVSVPEPAMWAMMVLGFGLVGLGVRRRRTTAASA